MTNQYVLSGINSSVAPANVPSSGPGQSRPSEKNDTQPNELSDGGVLFSDVQTSQQLVMAAQNSTPI